MGGEVGADVVVDIAGKDLDDVQALRFDHPGLKAALVKPNQFRITIAKDVPVGTHDVWAVGKWGLSGSRLFAVSQGLTEVRQADGNAGPAKAQAVPMNAAVNGISRANGADHFRFPARKGERVAIDCQAFRLDTGLRSDLSLVGPAGEEVARGEYVAGRADARIDFVAPADGPYVVRLHDVTYAGDQPYRLVISNRPQVEAAFPPAVRPGEPVALEVVGRNLPGGRPSARWAAQGRALDELAVRVTPPKAGPAHALEFLCHPLAPAYNGASFQCRLPGVPAALNPVTLATTDLPLTREREPNDTPATAQKLTLPTVVCGRFDGPGDVDWYQFTAKAGETVAIDLLAERLGAPGDAVVSVRNAKGGELAVFDDHGNSSDALVQANRDPVGTFAVPADGAYHLVVTERFGKGGARFVYALRVSKPRPDFYPVVFHETPNEPSCPTVRRGGSAFYEFCLNRRDGFDGMVTVEAEGLPKGVSCPPVHIGPNAEFGAVVFTANRDAPEWAGPVRLKAWATVACKRVERAVGCVQRRGEVNAAGQACRACRAVCLAVRGEAPYALTAPAAPVRITAGTAAEVRVALKRNWPEFKGAVRVTGWKPPPGFELSLGEAAPGQAQAVVKITVAAEVPPGTYGLALRGDAQVPFSPDPKAAEKPMVRVADPAPPLTVVVAAPAKK